MDVTMLTMLLPNLYQLADANSCRKDFLGLETWYHFLPSKDFDANCAINSNFTPLGANSDFLLIALAILDDVIRVAGLVAVGYVIWGGIQYVTSQGSPDATKKAQHTIINALIGVAIAIIAAAVVAFIGTQLSK